jgi:hypothetical protein
MLATIGRILLGALDFVNSCFAVFQQKKQEDQIVKAHNADALQETLEQVKRADEIDTRPTPADKLRIIGGL